MKTQYSFSSSISLAIACAHAIVFKDEKWRGWLTSNPEDLDEEQRREISLGLTRLFKYVGCNLINRDDTFAERTRCIVVKKIEAFEIQPNSDEEDSEPDTRRVCVTLSNNPQEEDVETGKEIEITLTLSRFLFSSWEIEKVGWSENGNGRFISLCP